MNYQTITVKLDVPGTVSQIKEISTEDDLFAFSRKLRIYFDQGLIILSEEIRDAMNDKLDQIYRSQQ